MKMPQYLLLLFTLIFLINCKKRENQYLKASAKLEANSSLSKQVQTIFKTGPTINITNPETSEFKKIKTLDIFSNSIAQKESIFFDGPIIENNLIAYRQYADPRNRISVFGKKAKALVMDTITQYPFSKEQNWGIEILNAGQSLGIGSPAIFFRDSLYLLADYEQKTIEIIEEDFSHSTIRTTFYNLLIGDQKVDLTQDWSLNVNQLWCEIQIKIIKGQLPPYAFFATGMKKSQTDNIEAKPFFKEAKSNGCSYMYSWGKQSDQQDHMGLAIIIEEEYQPKKMDRSPNYVYLMNKAKQNVHYRFMAAWEKGVLGIKDVNTFEKAVKSACQNL